MNDKLSIAILTNMDILKVLPYQKSKALSTRELVSITGIPQTSLYRRIASLHEWMNLGIEEKTTSSNIAGGAPENYYYLNHDFSIHIKKGEIVFVYHHKPLNS